MAVAGNFASIQVSTTKEAAYGTPVAEASILRHFQMAEPPEAEHEVIPRSNAGAAGRDWESVDDVDAVNTSLPLAFETTGGFFFLGWLASLALGDVVTTGASDPFVHTFERFDRETGLAIPSTTILGRLVGTTSRVKLPGIVVGDFFIEQARGDVAAKMGGTLMGNGENLASTFVPEALEAEDALMIRDHLDIQIGLVAAEATVKDRWVSARFEWDGNLLPDISRVGGDGLFRTRMLIGPERSANIILTLERDGTDTILDFWRDKTALEAFLEWDTGGSPNRQAKFRFPLCKVKAYSRGVDAGVAQETFTLAPLDNDTDPVLDIVVQNAEAGYLL